MQHLTVLYDARCPLCAWGSRWLYEQPQLVPLYFVPAGSPFARQLYPGLDHSRTLDDVTVISDCGDVYRNEKAWLMCLWALKRYRRMAYKLSSPAMAPRVKSFVAMVSKYRTVNGGDEAGCVNGRCHPS